MKFKTQYNKAEFKNDNEVTKGKSLTVPDQAMSIETLVRKYATGQPLSGKQGIYYGDDFLVPDVNKMDLAEIHEMKLQLAEKITDYRNRQEKWLKDQEAIKHEEMIQQEAKRLLEQQEKPTGL